MGEPGGVVCLCFAEKLLYREPGWSSETLANVRGIFSPGANASGGGWQKCLGRQNAQPQESLFQAVGPAPLERAGRPPGSWNQKPGHT